MRQYKFRTVVTLAVAAHDRFAWNHSGRANATAHSCLVQADRHICFPAMISRTQQLLPASGRRAVLTIALTVTIALADDEATAHFAPGQQFTMWDDGIAGHAVRPGKLIGQGVIVHQIPLPPAPAKSAAIHRKPANALREHRLTATGEEASGTRR